MGHMMGHKMKTLPKRTAKKLLGSLTHLTKPQPERFLKPRIPPFGAILLPAHLRVERIGHVIDIAGGKPGMVQAETDRTFGQLMRVVEFRRLAMLDAIEPLLLNGGDEYAVDEQGCRRLVIHRVDSKNVHRPGSRRALLPRGNRRPSCHVLPQTPLLRTDQS